MQSAAPTPATSSTAEPPASPVIVLLTHADSDLAALGRALPALPQDFPRVCGHSLQGLGAEGMGELLDGELSAARVIVVRILGRLSSVSGWQALHKAAADRGQALLVVSGTGEPSPELECLSSVAPRVLHETQGFLQAGGPENLAQCLRFLADHLLLTGYGYEPPVPLPEHGIYWPGLSQGSTPTLESWLARRAGRGQSGRDAHRPVVGITFYRAHRLSGNLRFIDTLIEALERRGLEALPVYTSSLRALDGEGRPAALSLFFHQGRPLVDALINTTSFATGEVGAEGPTLEGGSAAGLAQLDVPVFQAIVSGMERAAWESASRGLTPLDTAMNVVLPEFDGRILTVPLSFKEKRRLHDMEVIEYAPLPDRVERIAGLVAAQVRLRRLPRAERRIAFVLTNSNAKAAQIGNAVGLDAPASLLALLRVMRQSGYRIEDLPESSDELMHGLIDLGCYDLDHLTAEQCGRAVGRVDAQRYRSWFGQLPHALRERMSAQWGAPPGEAYAVEGHLILTGLTLGNALVAIQPPRGFGLDPDAIYHQPDLPPTHHYYAFYRWLRDEWGAHAIVHVGKHGTLEWLPGKGVGLSENCFPDALLGELPLLYPFIINDPGEGAQAKRRAHAAIVDHLTPPMTTAETYGALAQLAQLVDEYYQLEMLDPTKLPLLQRQIWRLVKESRLDRDLNAIRADDNEVWDEGFDEHGVPLSLARMEGADFAHLIEDIDGYLCEIGAAQIRDGLHVLGAAPQGTQLTDMLCSLTRLPNLGVPGLPGEVARCFGLNWQDLLEERGRRLPSPPAGLERCAGRTLTTRADAIEAIEQLCRALIAELQTREFAAGAVPEAVQSCLGGLRQDPLERSWMTHGVGREAASPRMGRSIGERPAGDGRAGGLSRDDSGEAQADADPARGLAQVLEFVCRDLVPRLHRTGDEIENLLRALEGRYVPAGPSGAPTRGMAHILPTGRNFYSVDPRSLPSQVAWRVGEQLAAEVLRRHLRETGRYPESVSISVWGTSAMRTHGDDVAEILALLGVRPLWQAESRRLTGIEVIALEALGRPRIDVTTRISGFFRDAFPQLIELIDRAVEIVIGLDEPPESNFVRKHFLAECAARVAAGEARADAVRSARYRVFGSKPGSYGAGILPLIQEGNWQGVEDFAEAYLNWGGYAYTAADGAVEAREPLEARLAAVEVVLHNQDNREHDIFDSDDYLQFQGGLIATIRHLSGRKPRHYFGDTHNPESAAVRDLKEEALRVFRSRVVNPKWLESIRRHGYKGALECAATVDYLFGFDATAEVMEDWMYEQTAQSYALDVRMREFLEESNPWALSAIAGRLLEAAQRGMWASPEAQTLDALREAYLRSETALEGRGEAANGEGRP